MMSMEVSEEVEVGEVTTFAPVSRRFPFEPAVAMEVDLHSALIEALTLEPKYQPVLTLPHSSKDCNEISMRMRNGSAHVLRCLKVWYDLPAATFFLAVNLMDRFLTRMRAQPKHLSCIAVSAFHLSCTQTKDHGFRVPDRLDLTNISQAKCGPGDVSRMERIMVDKLAADMRCQQPITPLTLLRLVHASHMHLAQPYLRRNVASPTNNVQRMDSLEEDEVSSSDDANSDPVSLLLPSLTSLTHKLEILACDSVSTTYRPSELALALLTVELQVDVENEAVHQACLVHLYDLCKLNLERFEACCKVVGELMDQYKNQRQSPHRQRLVWKLSNRTLRQLRPTDKLKKRMPTIDERHPPPHPIVRARLESCDRYSSCSEEEMDFNYDEEFPPLPPPSLNIRSPLKSASASPRKKKKQGGTFPYPKLSRKHHARSV